MNMLKKFIKSLGKASKVSYFLSDFFPRRVCIGIGLLSKNECMRVTEVEECEKFVQKLGCTCCAAARATKYLNKREITVKNLCKKCAARVALLHAQRNTLTIRRTKTGEKCEKFA